MFETERHQVGPVSARPELRPPPRRRGGGVHAHGTHGMEEKIYLFLHLRGSQLSKCHMLVTLLDFINDLMAG